ncbi:rcc01693 family protein [Mycoplana sp. BE70]|uniref:rcc01693 family protein n=1 Tax=Mycoplana sp. BE70 TaxID=2817775 RepID=UPI00286AA94B|nr:rcc01693 family protein [Mycoplana sp. BE70]
MSREAAPFPWEAVLHAGLCRMRLDPKIFWTMTPLEFAIAAGLGDGGGGAPDRRGLEALMQAFPDARLRAASARNGADDDHPRHGATCFRGAER